MNILMILDRTYPPDVRVEKEARALISCGHKVLLIARMGKEQRREEIVHGVHVFRVNTLRQLPLIRFFADFFYNYFAYFTILKICGKHNIDALHVHDLPLALATCVSSRKMKKPVVFDMHEDYIPYFSSTIRGVAKLFAPVLLKFLEIQERVCVNMSTRILVVVEEEIERLVSIGTDPEKMEVIPNTADTDVLDKIVIKDNVAGYNDKFVICYVGGLSKHRGLDTMVRAMPSIVARVPNAHLLLVGNGGIKELVRLCKEFELQEYVTFTGWVSFEEAIHFMKASDLCVIPYHKTRQTEKSFPHKLTQYMYLQKPVVASDVSSLKRIVKETRCGIVFEAGNPKELAERIVEVSQKREELMKMGKNGRKAVLEKYNWALTSKKLCKVYEQLF